MLLPRTQAMPVLQASPGVRGGETITIEHLHPSAQRAAESSPGPPRRAFQSTFSRAELRPRTRLQSNLTARARETQRNGLAPFQELLPFDHFNGK